MWLKILTMLVLLGITYEDVRYRLVRFVLYLILVTLVLIQRFQYVSLNEFLDYSGINLIYIVLLLAAISIYLYVKYGRFQNLMLFFGVGDILLWIILACWFDTVEFIIFNSISLIVALLLHVVLTKFSFYKAQKTVPLAGFQSLCFLVVFIFTSWG